jgi:putrescine aminotransferase
MGDRLVFAPPLVIEPADIEEMALRLRRGLDELADELAREGVLA